MSILSILFAGCKKDNELKKSVFISDSENPELPAYSEWGYNTFGAYYDREVFVSNDAFVPAKIVISNNTMSFILDGQKGTSEYNNYSYYHYINGMEMMLTFKLSGFLPDQYTNLTAFNDTIIDLKNPAVQVMLSIDSVKYTPNILSGELTFKRVQNLKVDKKSVEVILSGYFDFQALINDKPVTVSEGRFDVGINSDNFYLN